MRVLISAYACMPGHGSEPAVGWNAVRQAARKHEVWVITRQTQRSAIEADAFHRAASNVRWLYLDLPPRLRVSDRRRIPTFPYYYFWQIAAYFAARRLHREHRFDLVHHVTFATYWLPSFLHRLPAPFLWGPVGGGESAPWRLHRSLRLRGRVREAIRLLVQHLAHYDPSVRATARRAALSLATTPETAGRLRGVGARAIRVMSQVGLPDEDIHALGNQPVQTATGFRVLSAGRLLDWKGFHLGLAAFGQIAARLPEAEYWIVGDGPERARLEALAVSSGIDGKVRFVGEKNRAEVFERLRNSHVLVHPSLHDSGAYICAEAMAAGLPVVCLDLGGPAMQVTPECGFRVSPDSPARAIEEIAGALLTLAGDPELRARMGEASRRRVAEALRWECRGDELNRLYEEIVSGAEGLPAG